ncbi:ImmA/IrrE family metallo-endopeptidase [Mesorhizobium sp. M1A.F.Ca.IN.020.06.1.1]|uniref:ImmA/IrrE family metallo-endopeptidase n=1 Tax=unclassified Mesorhizobium TaxID=325217 RepID=UPI000FCC72A6|nr:MULTISPECIES: ImmA/IrrE family metallo-endopeptidase [unclassified Mesorhizobium]RUV81540.1 ImmA/IrrE family metallo-endopeptidase [Mesorhizobium sp. M1A.F.Ca.IN.020.32.1.1]RUW07499.1 ImmA/IrrE family metallo-endopeptidase [Mesorhizobium sp. M1A.F.Ca.IN.022.05.2.1]RUW34572.1 ImmA/IrrE family metallo-endopeptidase [Mesorhizobium sp. M1A.F.Ca.IN.020.06.1.1]RWF83253.1 MAG: ImmA/IrrE family metallo-endopeptidase [Mesorhizobium sp.]RWG06573.1 MAG: ImmA/IrrE family metallo-endopeptidase [Mesorhiz
MRKANPAGARNLARSVLAESGVRSPPVPVERLIKARGITLQFAPLGDDLSGMAYIRDGLRIIGVNALHHPNRQRFSAAHELAHHLLHAEVISEAVHVDRILHRDRISAEGTDPLEVEANAFAAELLMPEAFLADAIGEEGLDLDDDAAVDALARRFKVSASAVRNRLSYSW